MHTRLLPAVSALLLTVSALLGTQFSGATFTQQHQAPAQVHAKDDWAPPVATTDSLPVGVSGTAVSVSAHAADDRSAISSITLEYLAPGASSWTPITTGCTFTPQSDPKNATASCSWDVSGLTDGDYQVHALATDAAGYTGTSDPVPTSVGNNGVLVLSPIDPYVRGVVTVTGTVYNLAINGSNQQLAYRPTGSTGTPTPLLGSNQCAANSNPIVCSWDTSVLSDGYYDMIFTASKVSGKDDHQNGIVVDNTAPTGVAVTVPSQPLYGTVTLSATASDATAGIDKVTFLYQQSGASTWSTCGTATTTPYTCSLDTSFFTNGSTYNFKVVAQDRSGNTTDSSVVTRSIDNSPASVSITNPVAGSVVNSTVPVTVSASAPSGVTQVRVELRNHDSTGSWSTVCTDTTSPYSCAWDTTTVANGDYDLHAVMSRNEGSDVTSADRTITVDNDAGTLAIDPALDGMTQDTSDPLLVTGTIATTRTVTQVEIKATPTNPSGAVVTIPCDPPTATTFSCTWDTSAIVYGEYDLRAEMTQSTGTVVSSPTPVHVTVDHVAATVTLGFSPAVASGRVAGTQALSAAVTSNYPVTSVRFEYRAAGTTLWDGLCTADTTSPYECSWNTLTKTPDNGDYDVRAVLTLQNGQTVTDGTTVTVANLWGASIDATPAPQATSQTQQPSQGDAFTFTYSTRVAPGSLVTGWDGSAPTSVTVTLTRQSAGGMTLSTSANLGTIAFANDFTKGNGKNGGLATIPASLSMVTVASGRSVVTVQLTQNAGNDVQTVTGGQGDTMVWTPSNLAAGYAVGNACATTAVTEATPVDWDF